MEKEKSIVSHPKNPRGTSLIQNLGPEKRAEEHGSEKIRKASAIGENLQLLSSWQK